MTATTKETPPPPPMTSEPIKETPIIYSPPKDPVEALAELRVLEDRDEAAMVAELEGRVSDKMFNEINVRGQLQVSLSWPGVKQLTLGQGHTTIEQVQLSETPEKYRAICWALDKQRDVRVCGAAEQSKWMTLKDGTKVPDEFSLPKVVSKSQRNALRGLIPESLIVEAFKLWKNRDKTSQQAPASTPSKSAAKQPTAATWTDTTGGNSAK